MRRILILALALSLSGSPLFGESLKNSGQRSATALADSISRAAEQAAAQQARQERKIPPTFLWTGVGLLAGGGFYLARGAAESPQSVTCVGGECVSNRTVWLWTGTVLAGVGGALLATGISKSRHSSPSVTFVTGGVVVGQRLSF